MLKILKRIIKDILLSIYQPFWAAMLLSFLSMFLYLYAKEKGWKKENILKNTLNIWLENAKSSSQFRKVFFLFFYVSLILMRTLLNREIWANPLENIFGGWGFCQNERLVAEAIENGILFLPFSILLLWAFHDEMMENENGMASAWQKIWWVTKITSCFSLMIELFQVLFHLGTFQFADLFYNTLGGSIGGMIYCLLARFT